MDLHALALRAAKNEILAHYFGRKASVSEWEGAFKSWPEEQIHTLTLILKEIEGMELDVEMKASRRHEVADARLKQRFESLKVDLLNAAHPNSL